MRFTKLQQEKIEQIIQNEMQVMKEGWVQADETKRSSLLSERNLFEAAPIEQDLSGDKVAITLENVMMDEANAALSSFEAELLNHLVTVLRGHGLLESGASSGDFYETLLDFSETVITDAQLECVFEITRALEKYAMEISKVTTDMYTKPSV